MPTDPRLRTRIRRVGPATLLHDASHNLIASTHPSPTNIPHLFPYSVQWKFTSRTIYAADQRVAQTFGYHLLKSVCRSDPVVRHLISVTRLDPSP